MLKSIVYGLLVLAGLAWGLSAPLHAAIINLQFYFVGPRTVIRDFSFQRYQFIAFALFPITFFMCRSQRLKAVGNEGSLLFAMWFYGVICVLSTSWAVVNSEIAWRNSTEFFKTIVVAGLLPYVVRNKRDFDLLIVTCVMGIAHFAFLESIGKHHLGFVGINQLIQVDRHGSVVLLFLPLVVLLSIYGRRYERWLGWGTLPLLLDVIIRSNHRSYFVGIVAQLALFIILLPKRVVLRSIPAVAVGAALFVFVLTPDKYWEWMGTITVSEEERDGSAASRAVINAASVEMLKDFPMGVGYKNYAQVMSRYVPGQALKKAAHNTYFSVACQTGVIGFAAWSYAVLGSILLFRRARRRIDFRNIDRIALFGMGLEIGLYGTMVGDCFHNGHETDPIYWFVSFAVIMTRLNARFPQNSPPDQFAERLPLAFPITRPRVAVQAKA